MTFSSRFAKLDFVSSLYLLSGCLFLFDLKNKLEKATLQQLKEQNRNLALKILLERPTSNRAEIARISHLTRTTVSDIVAGLINEGLVREIGTGSSIGGKSPILLSLAADSRHLIGLDLAYQEFTGAIVNLRGQIREMVSRPIFSNNGENALQLAYEMIDRLVRVSSQPLVGICVATPGLSNTQEGVVIEAVNLDWRNLPLRQLLQDRYHLPVYVLNDCQAAAMGEYHYGNGYSSARNLVVVRVGHGIGAGIIINGQIFQGDNGHAGEIGHVVSVREGGDHCRCGNVGCLETVASARSVLLRAETLARTQKTLLNETSGKITLDTLEQAFWAGDALAQQIIHEAGYYLGMAISNLVGAMNINQVILTGIMTRFGELWLKVVQETAIRGVLPRFGQELTIEIGHLKDNEAILGASALLVSNYSLLFKRQ